MLFYDCKKKKLKNNFPRTFHTLVHNKITKRKPNSNVRGMFRVWCGCEFRVGLFVLPVVENNAIPFSDTLMVHKLHRSALMFF